MQRYFARVERHDFGLFTPLAAVIAVVPGLRRLAQLVLPALEAVDSATLRIAPLLGRFCWLTVVRLRDPQPPAT
jgi:hypothetical protein